MTAKQNDADNLVEEAAVGASQEVAGRVPGIEPEEVKQTVRSALGDVKRMARSQPLMAVGVAVCLGYLVGLLTR